MSRGSHPGFAGTGCIVAFRRTRAGRAVRVEDGTVAPAQAYNGWVHERISEPRLQHTRRETTGPGGAGGMR